MAADTTKKRQPLQEKGEKMHIASPPVLYFSQLFRYCSYNRKQSVSSLVF